MENQEGRAPMWTLELPGVGGGVLVLTSLLLPSQSSCLPSVHLSHLLCVSRPQSQEAIRHLL